MSLLYTGQPRFDGRMSAVSDTQRLHGCESLQHLMLFALKVGNPTIFNRGLLQMQRVHVSQLLSVILFFSRHCCAVNIDAKYLGTKVAWSKSIRTLAV